LEATTTATTTTYIDINLNNDKMTATIKLSTPAFNIKGIINALKLEGYKDINIIETDYFPEEAKEDLR
jgi:hypothetical protein